MSLIGFECQMQGAFGVLVPFAQARLRMRTVWLIAAMCILISVPVIPVSAAAWRSLQTEHFYVHYTADKADLAAYIARRAEAVHDVLTSRMGHVPIDRTHIVLRQGTDLANAHATPVFENQIVVYLAFPSVADQYLAGFNPIFDDWLALLLIHEYTHILHLDMQSEATQKLTSIFGRVPVLVSPLIVAPPLVLEGYAVYQESLDGRGRGSGTYYDMFLRTAVLEGRVPRIDQVLGEYPLGRWRPGGHVYFYGYAFLSYLADTYGPDLLTLLNDELVRRPDSLGAALKAITGRSLESLWSEWLGHITARYMEQIDELSLEPASELDVYETVGYHALFPTPAPSDPLVAYIAVGASGSQLRIFDLTKGTERQLADLTGALTTRIAWHPGGDRLVAADLQEVAGGFAVSHLVQVDLATGRKGRLPGTEHGFSPTFDATGSRLAYIRRDGLETQLWCMDWQTGEQESKPLPTGVTLLSAAWAPKGDTLALSAWDADRGAYLALYDIGSGEFLPIIGGGNATYDPPSWSLDGNTLLFASDRTGLFNLYAYDLPTGKISRLTHTHTGLFYPSQAASGQLLAMVYTADGYRMAGLAAPTYKYGGDAWLPGAEHAPIMQKAVQIEDLGAYTPWVTLRPTFLLPSVGESAGESQLRVLTAGQDVLGRMSYIATLGVGVTSGVPIYDIQWQQSLGERTGLSLVAQVARSPQLLKVGEAWHPYDMRMTRVGLEWYRPVDRGAYSIWLAGTHSGAEPMGATPGALRLTTLEGGLRYQSSQSYFDWRLSSQSGLRGAMEVGRSQAWDLVAQHTSELARPDGAGISTEMVAAVTGSGSVVYLGEGGSSLAPGGTDLQVRGHWHLRHAANVALKGNVEASIPLMKIDRGFSDTPIFMKDLRLHPYIEGGWAKAYGAEQGASVLTVGAELGVRTYLGFGLTGVDLRVGIAQGVGEAAHLYVRAGSNF